MQNIHYYSQVQNKGRHGQVNSHKGDAHTYRHCLFTVANQPCVDASAGLWEEAEVPGENPHNHRENMQAPLAKALGLMMH